MDDLQQQGTAIFNGIAERVLGALGALTQPYVPSEAEILLSELQNLAETMHRRYWSHVGQWRVLDDPRGVLSQIDNMAAGLFARVEQLEAAVSWVSPQFVSEDTPERELRKSIGFVVRDASRDSD